MRARWLPSKLLGRSPSTHAHFDGVTFGGVQPTQPVMRVDTLETLYHGMEP